MVKNSGTAYIGYDRRVGYPDIRRCDHRHGVGYGIGALAEGKNPVARVADCDILNRGDVNLSFETAAAQGYDIHDAWRTPYHRCSGHGDVSRGAVRRNDKAFGHARQNHVTGG